LPQNMLKCHDIYRIATKYTKLPRNIPNLHKIYNICTIKYSGKIYHNIGMYIYQYISFKGPPIYVHPKWDLCSENMYNIWQPWTASKRKQKRRHFRVWILL
jgi:hypothetical protein